MEFDADVKACAQIVQRGDAQRFAATLLAPAAQRPRLFVLYAFNLEVARAPWATSEPMIAEMRLQWWRDVLSEIAAAGPVRRHEVATPLSHMLSATEANALDTLVAARRWDIYREPFENQAHLERYLDQTAGTLMAIAGQDEALRGTGFAGGVAAWLRAVPALEALGRLPLVDRGDVGIKALAQSGLARLGRGGIAALPAAGTRAILKVAIRDPERVRAGTLPELCGPFARVWSRLTGRV